MKGILLAGGSGTRLYPLTISTSKQLLPIYDKPMVYYPLSVLMLSDIREIMIISTPEDLPRYKQLLGDGSDWGVRLEYAVQRKPEGLGQAFHIAEDFIASDDVCLVLGDNIFYGPRLSEKLLRASLVKEGATVFAYEVKDPEEFGVVEFDSNRKVLSVEEKPKKPKSNFAITGLYFYDNTVVNYAKSIEKSDRGEYEITAINELYLKDNKLNVELLGRGYAWLDTGSPDNLLDASLFVQMIERRQGYKIACLEEIAYYKGWISSKKVMELTEKMNKEYKKYLREIIQ